MHVRSRRPLQDVLTAIRLGVPVSAAGHALHPNAERHLRRIGHIAEARILEAIRDSKGQRGVDFIDESEVLTPADEQYHLNKLEFTVPFVCGCRDLGEALRRIGEGAAMIRTKGEAGTGNVVEASEAEVVQES